MQYSYYVRVSTVDWLKGTACKRLKSVNFEDHARVDFPRQKSLLELVGKQASRLDACHVSTSAATCLPALFASVSDFGSARADLAGKKRSLPNCMRHNFYAISST